MPDSHSTGWRRRIRCLIGIGHFPQKSPITSGSLAERDLQLKASYASSPPCSNSAVATIQAFLNERPHLQNTDDSFRK